MNPTVACPQCGAALPPPSPTVPPTVQCLRCRAAFLVGDGAYAAAHRQSLAQPGAAPQQYAPQYPPQQSAHYAPQPTSPQPYAPQQFAPQFGPPPGEKPTLGGFVNALVNGPPMPAYQAKKGAAIEKQRKSHFLKWVITFGLMAVAAVVLPIVMLMGDRRLFSGLVVTVTTFVLMTPIYLVGMATYAGVWFEWDSYMNSRRMRRKRAAFGDAGARKYYLGLGGAMMVVAAVISFGATLVGGVALALVEDPGEERVVQPPIGDIAQAREQQRQEQEKKQPQPQPRHDARRQSNGQRPATVAPGGGAPGGGAPVDSPQRSTPGSDSPLNPPTNPFAPAGQPKPSTPAGVAGGAGGFGSPGGAGSPATSGQAAAGQAGAGSSPARNALEERYGKPVLSKDALVNAMLANAGPNEPVLAQQVLEAAFKDVATAAKSFQEARDQADRLKQRAAQKPGDLDLRREHNRLMDEAIRAFAAYDEMRERWKGRIRVRDEAFQRAGKEMTAEQLRVLPADITFIRSDAPALTDMFPVQEVLESQSELARLRIAIEKEGFFSAMKPAERESLPADVMKHRRVLEEAERKFGYQAPELKDLPSMGELQQLVLKRSLAGDKFLSDAVEPARPQRTSAGTPIPPPPGAGAPGTGAAKPGGGGNGGVISFLADFRVSGRPLTDNVMYRPSALRSSLELNALNSDSAAGFIAAPLTPGPELEIVATRLNGGGPLYVAVTIGSQLVVVAFDALGGGPGKYIMGLARFDGQNLGSPLYTGPTAPCPRFQRLAPTKITFRMEGEELVVKVAGRDGFRYKPTLKRQPPPDVFSNTKGATICVGCSKSIFNIDQVNFHPTPKP